MAHPGSCDGGGTSTFHSKRAGTNELTMKSRPSDGAERATLTGIAVISNAVSDGVLSSVVVTAKKTSIAPGGKVTLKASGIDAAGGPAELPENLQFVVEDEEFGSITDDKFISSGKFGEAVINASVVDVEKVKAAEDRLNAILAKYDLYTYPEEPSDMDIFLEDALEGTSKFLVDTIGGGSVVDWVLSPVRNLAGKIFG